MDKHEGRPPIGAITDDYVITDTRQSPPGMRVNRRLAYTNRRVNVELLFYFRLAQKRWIREQASVSTLSDVA
jgi:hypothetical protein